MPDRIAHPPKTPILICVCLSAAVYVIFLSARVESKDGHFYDYLDPGGQFAAPANLTHHRFAPRAYTKPTDVGWDGQFYYYMADDPFILKDTAQHMDMSIYRYQRVGFPAFTKLFSLLFLQNWVSPVLFYFVGLGLILVATGVGADFLQERGYSPYYILLWSISYSPLLSLTYGFTDGMADAFLILSIICLMRKQMLLYVACSCMAALSREAYVLIPTFVAMGCVYLALRSRDFSLRTAGEIILHGLPALCVVGWQLYVAYRLGGTPVGQGGSGQFIGVPFYSLAVYLADSFHLDSFPTPEVFIPFAHERGWIQRIGLCLYIAVLIAYLVAAVPAFVRFLKQPSHDVAVMMGAGFIALAALYFSLGPVMFWHHVGYAKAISLFSFAAIFVIVARQGKIGWILSLLLLSSSAWGFYLMTLRVPFGVASFAY